MINSGISLRPACAVVAALCVMSGAVWGGSVSAEHLLELAELGNAQAQYAFADRLAKGDGVEQSWQLAADWYLLAAEQGHPEAQHALGVLFMNGLGVARNERTAVGLFFRAAAPDRFGAFAIRRNGDYCNVRRKRGSAWVTGVEIWVQILLPLFCCW